jgi:hypothetical protein
VVSKLITLLLLNGTLLPILAALIVLYSYLRSWVLDWNAWTQPRLTRLRPLIIGLQAIGLLVMVLWSVVEALAGWWADPWPLGDSFSIYQNYVALWLEFWLKTVLLGLPAFYAVSTRWVRQRSPDPHSQRWIIIATTLGLVLGFLILMTPLVIHLFWN